MAITSGTTPAGRARSRIERLQEHCRRQALGSLLDGSRHDQREAGAGAVPGTPPGDLIGHQRMVAAGAPKPAVPSPTGLVTPEPVGAVTTEPTAPGRDQAVEVVPYLG